MMEVEAAWLKWLNETHGGFLPDAIFGSDLFKAGWSACINSNAKWLSPKAGDIVRVYYEPGIQASFDAAVTVCKHLAEQRPDVNFVVVPKGFEMEHVPTSNAEYIQQHMAQAAAKDIIADDFTNPVAAIPAKAMDQIWEWYKAKYPEGAARIEAGPTGLAARDGETLDHTVGKIMDKMAEPVCKCKTLPYRHEIGCPLA